MANGVRVKGLEAAERLIRELQGHIEAAKAMHAEAANVVYNDAMHAFETQTAPDGTPWTPLKPETVKRKGSSRMLYKEGTLQDNLYAVASPFYAEVGISATAKGYPYPAVHQYGSRDGSIPARRFFPIDNDNEILESTAEKILAAIGEGIDKVIGD